MKQTLVHGKTLPKSHIKAKTTHYSIIIIIIFFSFLFQGFNTLSFNHELLFVTAGLDPYIHPSLEFNNCTFPLAF